MKPRTILSLSILFFISFAGNSKVNLPHVFTDNMVIQSDTIAQIWGNATPNSDVNIAGSWGIETKVKTNKEGKWKTGIPTPSPSFDPVFITITDMNDGDSVTLKNVLPGEVWIASGQSNMEMPLRGFWHQPVEGAGDEIMFSEKNGKGIRFLNVPRVKSYEPLDDFEGGWQISNPENAGEFSAAAWFFARFLKDIIDRPIGIVSNAWGGSKVEGWVTPEILATYPDRDYEAEKDSVMNDWERIGIMYNSQLNPVAGYTAKGFLWNQGESNVGGHADYPSRQNDMVELWRSIWGNPDMPFYFVELPGWDYGDVNGTSAALFREAQHKAESITKNSHIISTSDLVYPDEPDDIHARNKKEIGKRLAAQAATYSYGIKGIPHEYPKFKNAEINGNKAEIFFDNVWQGFTPNDELEGFEVAGEDRVFFPAKAHPNREGLSIIVESEEIPDIKSVRYNFKNFAIGKIHNNFGLPIVPFRTDNWEY
ncbi:MAG: sialate O-acetylesterase [Muribaculaceae bacterium]|nr:sialate O-acetylesterase [Muribaculaceae bacterium]